MDEQEELAQQIEERVKESGLEIPQTGEEFGFLSMLAGMRDGGASEEAIERIRSQWKKSSKRPESD